MLSAAGALLLALLAATGRRTWDALGDRMSLLFTIALDIQVLIGVVLWVIEQRWVGDVILSWLHPIAMLAAVALAHVGRARSDRESNSRRKGRTALIFFGASLLIILLSIPIYSWPV